MSKVCSFKDCENPVRVRGLCKGHDTQMRRGQRLHSLRKHNCYERNCNNIHYKYGLCKEHIEIRISDGYSLEENICSFPNCQRQEESLGLCMTHATQRRRGKPITSIKLRIKNMCSVAECNRRYYGYGYCKPHLDQVNKGENPGYIKTPNRKGYWLDHHGYIHIFVDGKDVRQHRYVMEQFLGRKLLSNENVHHINGDRSDNRIENLELWSSSQPPGQRVIDKIKWAQEILEIYKDLLNDGKHSFFSSSMSGK